MSVILSAIAPNFLLILMGWGLNHRRVLDSSFWVQAEKITYFILFPALLTTNLAEAKLDGLPAGSIVAVHFLGITATAALTLALRAAWPALRADGPAFTSLFQGSVRPNTYIGFAASAAIWGAPGVTVTALAAALVIPLVNLLCVTVLVQWGAGGGKRGLGATLLAVIKNPLILACLLGIFLNLSGIGLPPVIGPLLKILAQGSLPLGLLCVGAGLDFKALKGAGALVAASLGLKLLAAPFIVGGLGLILGLDDVLLKASIIYAALPVAANSYMLARQMGGDWRLSAAIITASTIASAITLPLAALVIARLP